MDAWSVLDRICNRLLVRSALVATDLFDVLRGKPDARPTQQLAMVKRASLSGGSNALSIELQQSAPQTPEDLVVHEVNQPPIDSKSELLHNKHPWREFRRAKKTQANPKKENIVIVAHEATYTGAPKTALELGQGLADRYHVIFVVVRDGPRTQDFVDVGDAVFIPNSSDDCQTLVNYLSHRFNLKCAVLNSIVTADFAFYFFNVSIPTVAYVHEFAQTVSNQIIEVAFTYASELVFSTNSTFDSYENFQNRTPIIIPQGIKAIGAGAFSQNRTQDILAQNPDMRLILGSGTGLFRKGVDLFVETCRQISVAVPGSPVAFVWLGESWDVHDASLATILREQIAQSGLSNVFFEVANADPTWFLERADLFLLTSRLDPLPNAALEAMMLGTPVLSFRRTGGIPSLVALQDDATAEPFDTKDLAIKAHAMLIDSDMRSKEALRQQKQALKWTHFGRYIKKMAHVIDQAAAGMRANELKSTALSSALKLARVHVPDADISANSFALSRTSGHAKELLPGFSSRIFTMYRPELIPGPDATLAYLRSGTPAGPWNFKTITRSIARPSTGLDRTVIHIHSASLPGLDQILNLATEINKELEIILTCPLEATATHENYLANTFLRNGDKIVLHPVLNVGRNFGALRQIITSGLLDGFDYVCHVHNKVSPHIPDRSIALRWREDLFMGLIEREMLNSIVRELEVDKGIGLVYPESRSYSPWAKNWRLSSQWTEELGVVRLPVQPDFPVGGMFFARTHPLVDIFEHRALERIEKPEPLAIDGEYVHALERLLPILILDAGFRVGKTQV
jgi:glycosyltransferase involved in cell wall biosynthesis